MSELREEDLNLAAGYVLGALDEPDRRRVESLLEAGDAGMTRAVREFREAAALMAHAAPAARPDAALRSRVLATARAQSPDRSRVVEMKPRRRPSEAFWNWGWAAAAAALAVVSAVQWNASHRLQQQLADAQKVLGQARSRLSNEQKWADVLASPVARSVRLDVTPDGDTKLVARVAYDPASQRAVVIFENFLAPTGKDYELWAIRAGKPAALGLIKTDAEGRAILELDRLGDPSQLAALAVSLEPAGGAPTPDAPTGPVVMLGKLSG